MGSGNRSKWINLEYYSTKRCRLVIVITNWIIFVIEQNSFDISPVFISMQLGTYNLANMVQGFPGGGV
jgi:hypothetical protein